MSLTKRFYSKIFLKAVADSKVKSTDNIKVVFSKIRSSVDADTFTQVAPFIRKYWDTEKNFINRGIKMMKASITGHIQDPALEQATIINTGTGKQQEQMVSVDNTLFSGCPSCKGRTFPGFNFCPHCGYTLLREPREPEPMLPLSDQPLPDYSSQGNFGMGGPQHGYMGSPTPVAIMPSGPASGPLGRGIRSKTDNKELPAHVAHDIDGHVITHADINRELKTVNRLIPK